LPPELVHSRYSEARYIGSRYTSNLTEWSLPVKSSLIRRRPDEKLAAAITDFLVFA